MKLENDMTLKKREINQQNWAFQVGQNILKKICNSLYYVNFIFIFYGLYLL
jgi:hypothetical protein